MAFEFDFAFDVQGKLDEIVSVLELGHVNQFRVICMRSHGSTARAYARIWNLPRIWQKALNVDAYYIIEVVSELFDSLPEDEQEKVLIHELMHIPKTFSGGFVQHSCFGKKIDNKSVSRVHDVFCARVKEREEKQKSINSSRENMV